MSHILQYNNCCVIKEDNGLLFQDYFSYLKNNTYFKLCNIIEDNNKSMKHLVIHINSLLNKFSNTTNLLNLEAFYYLYEVHQDW